jgi:hypothetical protein
MSPSQASETCASASSATSANGFSSYERVYGVSSNARSVACASCAWSSRARRPCHTRLPIIATIPARGTNLPTIMPVVASAPTPAVVPIKVTVAVAIKSYAITSVVEAVANSRTAATIPAAVTRVVTVHKFPALPPLVIPAAATITATLCRCDQRQREHHDEREKHRHRPIEFSCHCAPFLIKEFARANPIYCVLVIG